MWKEVAMAWFETPEVMIDGALAEIRLGNSPNTSQKRYHLSQFAQKIGVNLPCYMCAWTHPVYALNCSLQYVQTNLARQDPYPASHGREVQHDISVTCSLPPAL
jgi:hypothetical protein